MFVDLLSSGQDRINILMNERDLQHSAVLPAALRAAQAAGI